MKVIIPVNRYDILITRINSLDTSKWHNNLYLNRFLSRRCDSNKQFIQELSVNSYLYWSSEVEVDVIVRLFSFRLLPESERLRVITAISELAIEIPDSGFLKAEIKSLMTPDELNTLLDKVKTKLIPNLDKEIVQWKRNYNYGDDPEEYFEELKNALKEYKIEFEEDETITEKIDSTLKKIDLIVEELKSDLPDDKKGEEELFSQNKYEDDKNNRRSIFDDVDL